MYTTVYDWSMAGHLRIIECGSQGSANWISIDEATLSGTNIGVNCRFAFHPRGIRHSCNQGDHRRPRLLDTIGRIVNGQSFNSRVWSLDKYCVPCTYRYTYSYCPVQYSKFMVLRVGTSQVRSRGTEPLASLKILRANPLATILDGCASRIVSIMLQVRIHDGEMA